MVLTADEKKDPSRTVLFFCATRIGISTCENKVGRLIAKKLRKNKNENHLLPDFAIEAGLLKTVQYIK